MALIEINVRLSATQNACLSEVRAFIDLSPESGLLSELEVALVARGDSWHGAFAVPAAMTSAIHYRLGFVAHAGATWSYQVTQRGARRPLAADADCLPQRKCWIVGTCELPAQREARLSAEAASTLAAAPSLSRTRSGGSVRHLQLERFEPAQDRQTQHDRPRDAPKQQRLFVLRKLVDEGVGPVHE